MRQKDGWHYIAISLIDAAKGVLSAMAWLQQLRIARDTCEIPIVYV